MIETIKKSILQGNFLDASNKLPEISDAEFEGIILDIVFDLENIVAYSFLCFLMIKGEAAEFHSLAIKVMVGAFFYVDGSYATGLYHARRRVELCPENLDFVQDLVFFNDIPETLVSDEEVVKINAFLKEKNYNPST